MGGLIQISCPVFVDRIQVYSFYLPFFLCFQSGPKLIILLIITTTTIIIGVVFYIIFTYKSSFWKSCLHGFQVVVAHWMYSLQEGWWWELPTAMPMTMHPHPNPIAAAYLSPCALYSQIVQNPINLTACSLESALPTTVSPKRKIKSKTSFHHFYLIACSYEKIP